MESILYSIGVFGFIGAIVSILLIIGFFLLVFRVRLIAKDLNQLVELKKEEMKSKGITTDVKPKKSNVFVEKK